MASGLVSCALFAHLLTSIKSYSLIHVITGNFPTTASDFVLFHQPSEKQLEVIRLTGGPAAPTGSLALSVENLSDRQKPCTELDWSGLPTVPAKAYQRVTKLGSRIGRVPFLNNELKVLG